MPTHIDESNWAAVEKALAKQGGDAASAERVLLYFTASWCPPCQEFTPVLGKAFRRWAAIDRVLPVVVVPWDEEEDAFAAYASRMPFGPGLPVGAATIPRLNAALRVQSIPTLLLVDRATRRVVVRDARTAVVEGRPLTRKADARAALKAAAAGKKKQPAKR